MRTHVGLEEDNTKSITFIQKAERHEHPSLGEERVDVLLAVSLTNRTIDSARNLFKITSRPVLAPDWSAPGSRGQHEPEEAGSKQSSYNKLGLTLFVLINAMILIHYKNENNNNCGLVGAKYFT